MIGHPHPGRDQGVLTPARRAPDGLKHPAMMHKGPPERNPCTIAATSSLVNGLSQLHVPSAKSRRAKSGTSIA